MKSKTKRSVIIGVAAAALLGAGVFLGIWLGTGTPEPEAEPVVVQETPRGVVSGRGTVVTEDNLEEVLARRADPNRFAHYLTQMSIDWVFETATSASQNMYVANDPSNPGTVFFDLVLPETGEVIFSSPYIPLGARLDSIYLDVELPPGTYRPVVIYHLVDEYYEVQATVSVAITLRILG